MNGPLFIIGSPRSGSTFLYELITNHLDVLYPDNLAFLFGRFLRVGLACSRRWYGPAPHNCFTSCRGRTWRCGLRAPNELERYFRAVFRDDHTVDSRRLNAFAGTVIRATASHGRPIVFKSLRLGLHIRTLASHLPSSRFLHIRRDPVYTVQSILLACKEEGADSARPWYVVPRNSDRLTGLRGPALAVRQVYELERDIASALSESDATIDYADVCRDPDGALARVGELLGPVPRRPRAAVPRVAYSERQLISDVEFAELSRLVSALEWR